MRLLVCGNRDWTCRDTIRAWLRRFPPGTTVIHGAQRTRAGPGVTGPDDFGADFLAGEVARELGFIVEEYPAEWDRYGRSAGPIRNSHMAEKDVNRGLAFGLLTKHGGGLTGTGDMVVKLNRRGVLVTVVPRPGVMP